MNKRYILIFMTLFLFASCIKEQQENQEVLPVEIPTSVTVVQDSANAVSRNWTTSDALSLFIGTNAHLKYGYDSILETGEAAAFKHLSTIDRGTMNLDRNYAVYPYISAYNKAGADCIVHGRIVEGQEYDADNTLRYAPMVAISEDNEFILKHVASVIRVNINKSSDLTGSYELEKIRIVSSSTSLSGVFEVDTSKDIWIAVPGGDDVKNEVSLSFQEVPVALTDEFKSFLISVFPASLPAEDLKIYLTYNGGLVEKITYSEPLELDVNGIKDINHTISSNEPTFKSLGVDVQSDRIDTGPVSELLFGSFSEMHGGDLVPGVCEQYIVNTSFEPWVPEGIKGETKNELVYTDLGLIPQEDGIAYPWEKRIIEGTSVFEVTSDDKCNTKTSQKITLESDAAAAIVQRLALPFYRTCRYKLKFNAKVVGDASIKVFFREIGVSQKGELSDVFEPKLLDGEWNEYGFEFSLKAGSKLFNKRHTQYDLWFEFTGSGSVYLDQTTLYPSDCIDGIFNPETVAYFKEYNVKAIRWPGGNYTSGYDWKNGVGDMNERPCLVNQEWGGLDSNILGTDEFMRFCELTGAEPIIAVGYNPEQITEKDIADWVEYCNGAPSTPMGAKRAENGHPEPYKVRYWGIGNEVYGSYQLGNTDALSYASGLLEISKRVKEVDPEVSIIASGRGVHNQYRGAYSGWSETVYDVASTAFDLLDSHLYVYGSDNDVNLTDEQYFRAFVAANLNLRDFIDDFRQYAPDKKLAILEWGVLPRLSGSTYPTPQRQTFANLLVSACEYHEMIRNCDVVSMAALHNFSFYVAPQKLHSEPVNMRTTLIKELSAMAEGVCVPVSVPNMPVYKQDIDMLDVGIRNEVPELDIVAVRKKGIIYLSCVNRSLDEAYHLDITQGGVCSSDVAGKTYTCSLPYARSLWGSVVVPTVRSSTVDQDGMVRIPPLSYSVFQMKSTKEEDPLEINLGIDDYESNGGSIELEM